MLSKENKNKIKDTVKEYLMNYISKIKREGLNNETVGRLLLSEVVFKMNLIKE